jgi:putative acetyltransferase
VTPRSGRYQLRDAIAGDAAEIRLVVASVMAEYGLASDLVGNDADLQDVVSNYSARGGAFRVVTSDDGEIVGCGGLYPIDDRDAEIRRMYFLPEARGLGLGRKMLEELIALANERRFERIVLETASILKGAIALYRKHGFVQVPRERPGIRQCDQAYILELAPENKHS